MSSWGEDYQIGVSGGGPNTRVLFRSFARELRDDFRWAIYKYRPGEDSDRDRWTIPFLIELWGSVDDVYRGRDTMLQVQVLPDNRFHIRIRVRLHDSFEEESFRLEMLRALVVEQMLDPVATRPDLVSAEALAAPEWLVYGFDELLEHRRLGRPSAFYEGVLRSGQMLSPAQLFAESDPAGLDPLGIAVYRASAAAMVEALLDQPRGDDSLRALLADLPGTNETATFPMLRQHFPAFREMEQGLEKWWVLQVASLGQQQSFEFLDRDETERWLTEALTIRFDPQEATLPEAAKKKAGFFEKLIRRPETKKEPEEPFVGTLEDHETFRGREWAKGKLEESFRKVQQLRMVGFPLYRQLLERYELVIEDIANGKTREIDAELAELAELRGTIRDTLVKTEDYMNFYEATRLPRRSTAFDDYLEMRRKLESRGAPRREDRISRYLDALEREFR